MITMRSLFPEAFTAGWIEWKLHLRASTRLIWESCLARLGLSFLSGRLGRRRHPAVRAVRIEVLKRASERFPLSPLQTTRTSPRPAPVTADARGRAVGTLPPAGGLTEVSGRG